MDQSKKIEAVRHNAQDNHESLQNAVNKASKDSNFISQVVGQLDALKFPAYKHQILSFIQSRSSDNNVIGLLNSLNDTVLFRDKYDVKQGLEQENSESKQQYQISVYKFPHKFLKHDVKPAKFQRYLLQVPLVF